MDIEEIKEMLNQLAQYNCAPQKPLAKLPDEPCTYYPENDTELVGAIPQAPVSE